LIDIIYHIHNVARIAHLDLNPNNILVRFDPKRIEVFLIDFGLARTFGDERLITYSGLTPEYFSPEQIQRELRP